MGFYGDFNGINGTYPLVNTSKAIEMGFIVIFNGILVIQSDINGIYPLVN